MTTGGGGGGGVVAVGAVLTVPVRLARRYPVPPGLYFGTFLVIAIALNTEKMAIG